MLSETSLSVYNKLRFMSVESDTCGVIFNENLRETVMRR
jgi:hypothetical protein